MITMKIGGETVKFTGAGWKGTTPGLLARLEASTNVGLYTVLCMDPEPLLTIADYVAKDLGGVITDRTKRNEYVIGRIC